MKVFYCYTSLEVKNKFTFLRISVVARVYAMRLVGALSFIYTIQTIMFRERGGVDTTGIGILIGVGTILTIVFEIPTGVIADRISRKHAIVLANVFNVLKIFSWLLWPSYTGYLIGTIFMALSSALESGAVQAYLYTALADKHKKEFGKVWAQLNGLDLFVFAFAALCTTLVGVRYELVLTMTLTAAVVGLLLSITLPADRKETVRHTVKPTIFKSALKHIRFTPSLYRLFFSGIIMVAMASYVNEFLALYYSEVGVATRWLPAVIGGGSVIGGFTFWTLHLWEGFLNKHSVLLSVAALVLFALSIQGGVIVASLGLYIILRLVRILQVQFDSNVQHLSNEETRATVASIGSFVAKSIAGVISVLIGVFSLNEQIQTPLRYSIFIGGAIYICIQITLKRTDQRRLSEDTTTRI